jgi:hypothetical protein
MSAKKFTTFKEFYPYYLKEHSNRTNRRLHFIGTFLVIVIFLSMLIKRDLSNFLYLPLFGYGFAWLGHFVFEKNKPATFKYPSLSLASDFVMFWHILTGKIKF